MSKTTGERSAMTPREVFELKERRVRQFDMTGQADLFAEDGVMEFPFVPAGMPRRLKGREAIRDVLGGAAEMARQAGVRLIEHDTYLVHETLDPEVIIVEFDAHGEKTDSGEVHKVPYIQVLRIRNGEIVLFRDYWSIETAKPFWGDATADALKTNPG